MARQKTLGQARELAKQMANFFGSKYVVWLNNDGKPLCMSFREVGPMLPDGAEVFEPAEDRPNELNTRELSAVQAGLTLLQEYCLRLPAGRDVDVEDVLTGGYKHNRLTSDEIEALKNRLMVTSNKK